MKKVMFSLLILSILSLVAFGSDSMKLTGAFFQLGNRMMTMGADEWDEELSEFGNLGMDTIIVQYSAYNDVYYFPSKYEDVEDGSLPDEALIDVVWEGTEKCDELNVKITRDKEVEWIIFPEIEIYSNGKNIASGLEYEIRPKPSANYPDQDRKLVDGSEVFSWGTMVGWQKKDNIDITFKLPRNTVVEKIRIPFMRSTVSGVDVPATGYTVSFYNEKAATAQYFVETPYPEAEERTYPLNYLMSSAEKYGINVYLGLALDSGYWEGEFSVKDQARYNKNIMKELYEMYKDNKSLAGWYAPEEIDDRNFQTEDKKEDLKYYLSQIVSYAKMLSKKPVVISPYFGVEPNGEKYAEFWDEIFSKVKIGIFAMQDGVGTKRTTVEESAAVFEALKPVMDKYGINYWANLEVFEQTHGWPVDYEPWEAKAASMDTLEKQIELISPFVEKLIIFDYPNYMSPETGSDLYSDYAEYAENK